MVKKSKSPIIPVAQPNQSRPPPLITPSMYLAAQAVLAQDADTEIEDEPPTGSSLGFSFGDDRPSRSEEEEIDELDSPPPSMQAPVKPVVVLKQPFQELAAYSSRAYLPPIPATVQQEIDAVENLLMQYPINATARSSSYLRSIVPAAETFPTGGKRPLAEIERIDSNWLDRAAAKWIKYRIPPCANPQVLEVERPDLIAHVNIGDITVPVLDPSLVTFSLPAPGYATDAIPGLDSPETGARIEEEGRPGLAQEGLQAAVEGQLSALDSMDDLQQSITAVSRAIINMHNGGDMEEDDGSDGGSHVSIDVDAIPGFNELPGVFKHTLLDTAASLAHVSEHDRTLNWTWLGLDEARYYRLENQPSVEHAETTIPNHCSVWVWGRRPLEPTIDQERQGKRQPLKEITPTPGRRIVVPGVKNEYYREDPNQIDSHETRWQYGELAMVCIFFPPTFGLTERDLHDISQSQEFSDGARGDKEFTPAEAVWALLHDLCKELGVRHFIISSYSFIACGAFSSSFESAFISPPQNTQAPKYHNDLIGPVMPEIEPIFDEPKSLTEEFKNMKRPNALQLLTYWMRSSMGDCDESWIVPERVDGIYGRGGAIILKDDRFLGDSYSREFIWPFLKPEGSSKRAYQEAHVWVNKHILSDTSKLSRTYTDIQLQRFFGMGSPVKKGGRAISRFVGGAEYNSPFMEARHAQVAQRLDDVALQGGVGASQVPPIITREQLRRKKRLTPVWVNKDDAASAVTNTADDDPLRLRSDRADGMEVEGPDPAAILASLSRQVPNAVLIDSHTPGEPPMIEDQASGQLYKVCGTRLVNVGNGTRRVRFADEENGNEDEEAEVVREVVAGPSRRHSTRLVSPAPATIETPRRVNKPASDRATLGLGTPSQDAYEAAKPPSSKRRRSEMGSDSVEELAMPLPSAKKPRSSRARPMMETVYEDPAAVENTPRPSVTPRRYVTRLRERARTPQTRNRK